MFEKRVVDTNMNLAHFAVPGDLDGDGDLDLVATSEGTDTVAWYDNDGSFNFTKRLLDSNLDSAYPMSIVDLDQDGDLDVLAAGYTADKYVWYENGGSSGFTRHDIDTQNGPHSIVAADIDGDGAVRGCRRAPVRLPGPGNLRGAGRRHRRGSTGGSNRVPPRGGDARLGRGHDRGPRRPSRHGRRVDPGAHR